MATQDRMRRRRRAWNWRRTLDRETTRAVATVLKLQAHCLEVRGPSAPSLPPAAIAFLHRMTVMRSVASTALMSLSP